MIKFDIIAHYQFGYYAPGTAIEPSPEIIGKFMEAFKGTEFMPNLTPIFHLGNHAPETRQMLTLITKKGDWVIEFEPHRFSFSKKHVPGSEMGSPLEFMNSVADFCKKVLTVIPIKANRLSYVTKAIIHEIPEVELIKINSKLLNLPNFYKENAPQEWTTRNIARYNSQKLGRAQEIYNVVTDINRVIGNLNDEKGNRKEIDRIEIGYDLNTNQKNTNLRFEVDDVAIFLEEVIGISNQITVDINEVVK